MSKPDRQLTLLEALRYYANAELNERESEEQIKALMLELVGEDKESRYDYGGATYSDTAGDSASVYFGRNDMRDTRRAKINAP